MKGNVDIIAQLRDQDDAGVSPTVVGAGNVGVYDLRWRICSRSAPTCGNWNDTHRFQDMPTAWALGGNLATRSQFSVTPNWVSTPLTSARPWSMSFPCRLRARAVRLEDDGWCLSGRQLHR